MPQFQCINSECLQTITPSALDAVFNCPHCGTRIALAPAELERLEEYRAGLVIISFDSTCPRGHVMTTPFPRGSLRTMLHDGTLRFWCNYCGESRAASQDEMEKVRKHLTH
jgi:DNA-directed RNA polymerase subunit RPC12/RpoP